MTTERRDFAHIDLVDQEPGTEVPEGFDFKACPRCGGEIIAGYGMAGGGIGAYWCCDDLHCGFFCKEQDSGEKQEEAQHDD